MKSIRQKKRNIFPFYSVLMGIFFSFIPLPLIAQADYKNQDLENADLKENIKNNLSINYFKKKDYVDYILGKGDVLDIKFISSINLNSDPQTKNYNNFSSFTAYPIDGSGQIYLPKLENIYVEGLTINELEDLLNEAYIGIFKKPNIIVKIKNYRPVQVFIDGEVENPGLYSVPGEGLYNQKNSNKIVSNNNDNGNNLSQENAILTFPKIYNIIRLSGGITPYSDLSNIRIIRKNPISKGGGKIKANINFLEVIESGDGSNNIRVLDGDSILIKKTETSISEQVNKAIRTNLNPLFISVKIKGRVDEPGNYFVNRTSALNDAIQLAGNLKVLKGKVKLTSFYPNGEILTRQIRYKSNAKRGAFNNPYLRNGDIITVEKGTIIKTGEVIGEITSPFVKVYTSINVIDAIFD